MTLTEAIQNLLTRDGTVCECRQCGTKVSRDEDRCPNCGSRDIVCYEGETLS